MQPTPIGKQLGNPDKLVVRQSLVLENLVNLIPPTEFVNDA
jgi:hypothetical protein